MSRIANAPVEIPAGVEVALNGSEVSIKGTKGTLIRNIHNDVEVTQEGTSLKSSAINNAKQFIKIQKEFGSFDEYLWGFVNHKPIKNKFKKHSDLACSSIISEKLSQDLKKHGFTFVGPIICYSLMQAVGMVNDHTSDCYKYLK